MCKMDEKYECDYCTVAFGDINGLEEHIVEHLTINEEDLQIFKDLIQHPENNRKGEKRKTTLSHEMNSSVMPNRLMVSQKIEKCVVSQIESSLLGGSENKNNRKCSIPCCICGHALTKQLKIHSKLVSNQVFMEYQCTACSLFFETVESLENHLKEGSCKDFNYILQQEGNFSAPTFKCTSQVLSQNEVSANKVVKDGKLKNRSYKCAKCERVCADFNGLLAHEETHIDLKPYCCVLCHTNFSTYCSYLVHIENHRHSHTRNQLNFECECKKCHKTFGSAWDLLMHDRSTHIDFYPFKCFACSKKYTRMDSLRHHKRRCYFTFFKEKLRQNLGFSEVSKRETVFSRALIESCEGKTLEKDIVCPVCKKKEESFPGLTHHFVGHFGFLQCIYCNIPFKKNITLERQMPYTDIFNPFVCEQCQQSPDDKEILSELVYKRKKKMKKKNYKKYDREKSRLYYENSKKKHKIPMLCDICGLTVKGRYNFIKHTETHNKPFCTDIDLHCPKCNALLESLFQLNRHLKQHHKCSDKIKCKICPAKLSSKKSLSSHVSRCHSKKEAKFECFECKKKFSCKRDLNRHSNIHMLESKPYKCDQCDAAFAQNCNLTKHKIIHTGKRPYKCDKCDAAFAHRSNLNKHSHIHTGKYPFRCNICNHGFDNMKDLTLHKKSHYSLSRYLK